MVLIGVSGKIGSGKSTFAKYLVDNFNFIEMSLADPLKKACQELFLLSDEQVFGNQEQKGTIDNRWGKSPRELLQFVGTDLLRNQMKYLIPDLHEDIFLKRFELWYNENKNVNVIVSDIRYPNELKYIKKSGGIVIKIERSNYDIHSNHSSESSLNNEVFDFIINNNFDVDTFKNMIDIVMHDIIM